MDIIDNQTVVVYNHADLSDAIANDNGYIYVHMGDSFTLTGGIRIHPGKANLNIDGIDPRDLTQTIHTLTDYNSNSNTGCIYLNAVSSINIVFSNIMLYGRNYYGMPCIFDLAGNEAVNVSYHKVTYSGPQITWHPRGLTRYVDCDISIDQGYSALNEVCEVCHLEIGGVTSINHNNVSTTNPTFRFYNRGAPSLTILEDADVTITTVNDFFNSQISVAMILQERAKLDLTTQKGMSAGTAYTLNTFHLYENSVFHYNRLSNTGIPNTLYMTGGITLESGADFLMVADYASSTGALIDFYSGVTSITLNSPKRFALYNSGTSTSAEPFYFASATSFTFKFTCNQIDYWRTATPYPTAGTFDDIAPWRWRKTKWGIFNIEGNANNSNTNITSIDLTPEEQALLPPITDMQLHQCKVFAVGVLPLKVNTIVGDERPVTGISLPEADILVTYMMGTIQRRCNGHCMVTGAFSVPVDDPIPISSNVNVASNIRFLLTDVVMVVGELSIYEAPVTIPYLFMPIATNPIILPRVNPDEPVIISDERVDDRIPWVLWVKIDGPLRTISGLELPESVVFVRKGETTPITLTEDYINIHTDGPYDDILFSVTWNNNEGVLARITVPIQVGERYIANLTWLVLPEGIPPEGT